ncbi:ABC transporter permease [Dyadobacter arcticus]|uniref:ABC transport system permease protein n=1 Tax=Dyadobacter arcticus TaxID=1078754 RepID=A0ABX0USX9_9BACT|nr:ABC transporter permease [Dyadobacter arcticus]NIJ54785.1 putative ABC transport system permease protein [Dyadobacter arcticus]
MLQNYFKIAWRNLVRSKTYSILILVGLSCGLTSAIILGLYVNDELSFDRHHQNADHIYRLNLDIKWADNEYKMAMAATPFGPTLQREYPEIKNTLRIKPGEAIFRNGENAINVKEMIYADSSLFEFFDYDFIEGDAKTALNGINNLVLTEKLAIVLFGKTAGLIGKTVLVKDNIPFTVTGVIQDLPGNHHLKFDVILPYFNNTINQVGADNWGNFNTLTYIMLDNAATASKLQGKMLAFYKKYIAKSVGDEGNQKVSFKITFQPLSEMHLKSSHLLGEENGSSMRFVYTISLIGFFILLIAIVNYINLATARATGRAREIGVRKAVGSQRFQLIGQFLAESMLMSFLAMSASVVLLYLLLPFFNTVAEKTLHFDLFSPKTIGLFIAFTLFTGLVSGLYPAFILSNYNPAVVLKGAAASKTQGALLRKSLVVMQFSISMFMIIGTIVVYQQLQYMSSKELGFNQQQVINIPLSAPSAQLSSNVLKSTLMQNPLIRDISLTDGNIGGELNNKSTFSFYSKGKEVPVSTEYFNVDAGFLNVLQMRVREGRNFSNELDNDSSDAVLVNQAMLKRLGWKSINDGLIEVNIRKVPITGVINDFHLRSMHNQIEPLVIVFKKAGADQMFIKVPQQNIQATIGYIKSVFTKINPNQPFEYSFLDQAFAKQYKSDEQRGILFLTFSGIAILIACIGLFGLATFTAQQRIKEIGVRKVLGASVISVVALLSVDFLKLVGIAIIVAAPIGWYVMRIWLQSFAYKIELEWWVFAAAGLMSILIALATVSFQSIKAALMNPVKSLRTD